MMENILNVLQETLRNSARKGYTTQGMRSAAEIGSYYVVHNQNTADKLNSLPSTPDSLKNKIISFHSLPRFMRGRKEGFIWDHYAIQVAITQYITNIKNKDKEIKDLKNKIKNLELAVEIAEENAEINYKHLDKRRIREVTALVLANKKLTKVIETITKAVGKVNGKERKTEN